MYIVMVVFPICSKVTHAAQMASVHSVAFPVSCEKSCLLVVQTEMQEDLDHAGQLTEEYEVLRHDFEDLQEAHAHVQEQLQAALQDAAQARELQQETSEQLTAELDKLKADLDQAQGLAAAFMEVWLAVPSSLTSICSQGLHDVFRVVQGTSGPASGLMLPDLLLCSWMCCLWAVSLVYQKCYWDGCRIVHDDTLPPRSSAGTQDPGGKAQGPQHKSR